MRWPMRSDRNRTACVLLLAAVVLTASCDKSTKPPSPGKYELRVVTAAAEIGGALVRVKGEGITFIRAGSLQINEVASGPEGETYLIRGAISSGDVLLAIDVENVEKAPEYTILQLAAGASGNYAPLAGGSLRVEVRRSGGS